MLKLLLIVMLFVSTVTWAGPEKIKTLVLLDAVIVTGNSASREPWAGIKTFQAKGATTAGAGAATIIIQGSNTDSAVLTDWVTLCTITLTLSTTSAGDGCVTDADWRYQRARLSAISGTNATVTAYMAGGTP